MVLPIAGRGVLAGDGEWDTDPTPALTVGVLLKAPVVGPAPWVFTAPAHGLGRDRSAEATRLEKSAGSAVEMYNKQEP